MTNNNLISAALFTPNSVEFPNAWVGHLHFAAWIINEVSPKIFVELGTHSGNSYFSFCQSTSENKLATKCYAVDTWIGDDHSGQYNDDIFNKVNAHNQKHYAEFSKLLRMTFDDASAYFADNSINILHIDGLHTYEAVRHDFETWLPKLAPDAVVIFHDTNVRERNFGVWKLWEELQILYPNNLEFTHSNGLGVLQLTNSADAKSLEWLQPASTAKQSLVSYFAALGSQQLRCFELNEIKQHVANLNQILAERGTQVENFNLIVAQCNGQIANLNQSVAERDGQISSVNQSVAERDAQIANLNQSVAERDYLINEIYKSTSWKATRLMRIAGYQVKRVQSATRLISPAIKKCGGLKKTAYKAFQLYKRDGFTGIKSGFRFVARNGQVIPAAGSAEFDRNDYAEWIRRYDTLTNEMRASIKHSIGGLVTKPLISVLMPTYNPKADWLIAAIESVRNQIYPNWELCIADDASTNPTVREILEDYVKKDSRIKVVFREQNGHISAASNSALEVCTGEWIALLDHDDLLSEHALYWVADAINQHSDIQLIYSDEDKIDDSGRRFDPYFKCDWNLDLFYSHNLITHLGVYSAALIKQVNGFEIGLEGSQDYDLALRCIEHINPTQIHHIPRVLYHWRVHAESTASASDAKPYAMLAGEKALNQHLQRKGIDAKAELVGHGFRVHYALPSNQPKVSLIIPTRNGLKLIRTCVESILKKTTYTNYEILIIDNGSDDPEVLRFFEQAKTDTRVKVVVDNRPFNYSALNNAAVKLAQGTLIGLLNNDLEVISPNWLSEMVSIALQPKVGAVGARLWYPNETLQHGGVIVGIGGWAGHSHKGYLKGHNGYVGRMSLISGFTAVTGACLIVKKMIFEQVGGLNEIELKIACNDVDFCLRLVEAGYRNIWTPYSELYHHESATRGFEDTPEKQLRFREEVQYMHKRWGTMLVSDPAYSPNLTLDYEDFSYAWPPRIQTVFTNIS